jgi:alkaline phosphatase D
MAIAIRATKSLTRRALLAQSASTVALAGLGSLARPYLSRAADRPQMTGIQSGDVSGGVGKGGSAGADEGGMCHG